VPSTKFENGDCGNHKDGSAAQQDRQHGKDHSKGFGDELSVNT
jgi:hypothetical protein